MVRAGGLAPSQSAFHAYSLKHDAPPLLEPGRHFLSLAEVEEQFVLPFGRSLSRRTLFLQLEELVQRILRERIRADLMINGSFVTEKLDPGDLDVAVHVHSDFVDIFSYSQRLLIDEMTEDNYIPGLDIFVETEYPRDHPEYEYWSLEKTWGEQWGIEHAKRWCKGVAVLRLWESHVGLRIRR